MMAAARSRRFEFGEQVVDVGLDRALADEKVLGDLGVGVALRRSGRAPRARGR